MGRVFSPLPPRDPQGGPRRCNSPSFKEHWLAQFPNGLVELSLLPFPLYSKEWGCLSSETRRWVSYLIPNPTGGWNGLWHFYTTWSVECLASVDGTDHRTTNWDTLPHGNFQLVLHIRDSHSMGSTIQGGGGGFLPRGYVRSAVRVSCTTPGPLGWRRPSMCRTL